MDSFKLLLCPFGLFHLRRAKLFIYIYLSCSIQEKLLGWVSRKLFLTKQFSGQIIFLYFFIELLFPWFFCILAKRIESKKTNIPFTLGGPQTNLKGKIHESFGFRDFLLISFLSVPDYVIFVIFKHFWNCEDIHDTYDNGPMRQVVLVSWNTYWREVFIACFLYYPVHSHL